MFMKKKMILFGYLGLVTIAASLQSCNGGPMNPYTGGSGGGIDTTWTGDSTDNGGGNGGGIDSTGGNDGGGIDSTGWNPSDSTDGNGGGTPDDSTGFGG